MLRRNEEVGPVEAARRLGVELNYVYTLLRVGKLAGSKKGKRWRIPVEAVEARLRERGESNAAAGR